MKLKSFINIIISSALIIFISVSTNAAPKGIKIVGEQHFVLPAAANLVTNKTIKLNKIILSPEFKHKIKSKLSNVSNKYNLMPKYSVNSNNYTLQFNVDLGMENVPVLDQGYYGTCTTFATTAAFDAIKQSGDYISQQCLLELGNYEEALSESYISSGWEGAIYDDVLNRISQHGIVDKETCPHKYGHPNYKMTPNKYKEYSFDNQWANDLHWNELYTEDTDGDVDTPSLEAG